MTRLAFAVLVVGAMTVELQRAAALDEVCSNEIDPGPPELRAGFGLQCLKGEEEYAAVQCSSSDAGAITCSYAVSDPADFCAVSISCNVYFLSDQDEVLDHVYVEEGGTVENTGRWAKTRVACACLEWW